VIQDDINQSIDRCNSLAQTRTNVCYEPNYVKILKCKNVNSFYNETGYILTNRASIAVSAILQQAYILQHFQTTRFSSAALHCKVVVWCETSVQPTRLLLRVPTFIKMDITTQVHRSSIYHLYRNYED
jgi:hypothetical protein